MNDAVEVVDDEQEQELKLPMQPMVLERKGNLKRDQDRREEEQGNRERGGEQWVDDDVTPEDDAVEEMLRNDIVPVEHKRGRLLMKIKKAKFTEPEETEGPKE